MPLVAGGILLAGIYRETGALLPATREQSRASESLDD